MITSTDLNFRRKMQVSPVPRYNLEHELKFGPKSSTYFSDTLSSSLDQPFHFASSSKQTQQQQQQQQQQQSTGQSNQSTRPSTPNYLLHDHPHHHTGHHSHHHPSSLPHHNLHSHPHHLHASNAAHHLHSHLPLHSQQQQHASHLNAHSRRPRSSIFSSLPGSPVHGYHRDSVFNFNNWRDDCFLPSMSNTSDRDVLRSTGATTTTAAGNNSGHCVSCCPCCLNGEVCNDANCQCCNPYPGVPGLPSLTTDINGQTMHTSSVPDLRSSAYSRIPSSSYLTASSTCNTGRHGHISGSHMYQHLYSRHGSSPPPPLSSLLHCDTCTSNQLTNCTHLSTASVDTSKKFPSVSEITKPPFLDPTYNLIEKYDYNYDNYFKSKREKLFRPFFRSAPPSRSVTPDGLTVISNYLTSSSTPVPQLINNLSATNNGTTVIKSSAGGGGPSGNSLTINPSSSATIASTGSTSIVPAIANNKEIIDSPKVVFKNQLKYFVEERKNALQAANNSASCCPSRSNDYYGKGISNNGLNYSSSGVDSNQISTTVGGSESNINALLNMYSNPPDPVKSKFPPAGASTYQSVPQGCIDPSSVTCFTPLPSSLLHHHLHQQQHAHHQHQQHNSLIGRRHSFNGPLGVGTSANSSSSNYFSHHHPSYRPSPSPYPAFYSSYEPPSASSLLTSTAAAVTAGTQRLISSNPNIPAASSGGNLSRLDALNSSVLTGAGAGTGMSTGNYCADGRYNHGSSQQQQQQTGSHEHYNQNVKNVITRSSSPYPGHPSSMSDLDHHYSHGNRLPVCNYATACSIAGCVNCCNSGATVQQQQQQQSLASHHLHHVSNHHAGGHSHSHQQQQHHHGHVHHHSPSHATRLTGSSIDHMHNASQCINCPSNNTLYTHATHHSNNSSHLYPTASTAGALQHHSNSHLLHHHDVTQPYSSNYTCNSSGTAASSQQQHSTNLKISKYL